MIPAIKPWTHFRAWYGFSVASAAAQARFRRAWLEAYRANAGRTLEHVRR
jgi:uncharacterized protein YnzC (UPF0291/DUF896 family)